MSSRFSLHRALALSLPLAALAPVTARADVAEVYERLSPCPDVFSAKFGTVCRLMLANGTFDAEGEPGSTVPAEDVASQLAPWDILAGRPALHIHPNGRVSYLSLDDKAEITQRIVLPTNVAPRAQLVEYRGAFRATLGEASGKWGVHAPVRVTLKLTDAAGEHRHTLPSQVFTVYPGRAQAFAFSVTASDVDFDPAFMQVTVDRDMPLEYPEEAARLMIDDLSLVMHAL